MATPVRLIDSRDIRPVDVRPRHAAYLVLRATTIDVPPGSVFVPMDQPAAGIIAAALEPDSPGSYLGVGVIPMNTDETEAPVYRVMNAAGLPLKPCARARP